MMVVRRRRRNGNLWYLVVFLILLAVAVAMGYKVWEVYFKDTGKGDETGMVEDSSSGETEKKEEVEEVGKAEETKQEEVPARPQYDGENPNVNGGITGVMTYAGVSGDVLMIRVSIDQYLSGGDCALTLGRDGEVFYTEKVGVADSAATATCEGFNVPLTQISKSGEINIRITVNSGEKSGIIEGKVDI